MQVYKLAINLLIEAKSYYNNAVSGASLGSQEMS